MMNILEWDSRVQGIVSTGTVATEARASMVVPTEGEEVDLWTGMRETRGSRAENGEPINESTGPVLNGTEGGEEEDGTETSTVDGGNNRGVSGSGMRLLNYATPERRVDLFGFQGRVMSSIPISTFASIIRISTNEEVLVIFSEYAHNPRNQQAIHSTLQLTSHGMIVEDRSPRGSVLHHIHHDP